MSIEHFNVSSPGELKFCTEFPQIIPLSYKQKRVILLKLAWCRLINFLYTYKKIRVVVLFSYFQTPKHLTSPVIYIRFARRNKDGEYWAYRYPLTGIAPMRINMDGTISFLPYIIRWYDENGMCPTAAARFKSIRGHKDIESMYTL